MSKFTIGDDPTVVYDTSEIKTANLYQPIIRKSVGWYKIGDGIYYGLYTKPNWFHRKMVRIILGWIWEDN